MKNISPVGGVQRRLKKLMRTLGIPRLLGILIASILVFQFWVLPALTQQPVVITMMMQGQDLANWKPFLNEFQDKNRDIRSTL
jgi:multiple sugar transport system substrate-binding protein